MPWTQKDYPDSMKNLDPKVRNKAIEIANAILEDGKMQDEGLIIATSISKAKDWASHEGIKFANTDTDIKDHGTDQYVIPHENGWGVKTEKSKKPYKVYPTKQEAIEQGEEMAKKHSANLIIQGEDGKIEKKESFNKRN
jgi:uncharacterized protein YdaT